MTTTTEHEIIETEGETFGWVYPTRDGLWAFKGIDGTEIRGHRTRRKAVSRLIARADTVNSDAEVEARGWARQLRREREQAHWAKLAEDRRAREAAHVAKGGTVLGFLAGEIGL